MKFTAMLAAAAALTLATAAVAQEAPAPAQTPAAPVTAAPATPSAVKGEEVFNARCKMCHGDGGGAPGKDFLASKKPEEIFDALKTGPMAPMAGGLSDDDMKAVATYLTTKPAT